MLQFLFTDPATDNGQPFVDMMKDFVTRYAGRAASTDDFIAVANAHIAETPVGGKFGMRNLNWFFHEWVYGTELPSYRLEYNLEPQPNGSFLLDGTLYQDDVPKEWFMPLPLVLQAGKGLKAVAVVYAHGPQTPVRIRIPERPAKLELDPDHWVLSARTSTHP
jgi:aminopeptidase N